MWYFQSVVDESKRFVILPDKEYVLGRRDCDIVIEHDQSVSRKHAILVVSHPDSNVSNINKPASLTLKDISKFGTFVNDHKVKGQRQLQNGDEVRFGAPISAHRIVYEPFVISTSCVDGTCKKDVSSVVRRIGGHVVNDWRKDCHCLVMKTITVTIKVVCALVSQKPIVTIDYVRDFLKYLCGELDEKPAPENFLPPTTERLVNPEVSFHCTTKRSVIFLGMSFYFLCEKQFKKMSMAVELGGGVPILFYDPRNVDLDAFLEDGAVVMNPGPGEVVSKVHKDWIEKVKAHLQKNNKHLVQDAEVGYAVLYCSTENYCNPDKDVSHLLSLPSQSQTQAGSLASQAFSGISFHSQLPVKNPKGSAACSDNSSAHCKPVHPEEQETLSRDRVRAQEKRNRLPIKHEEGLILSDLTAVRQAQEEAERTAVSASVGSLKEEPFALKDVSTDFSKSADVRSRKNLETVTENKSASSQSTRSHSSLSKNRAADRISQQTRSRSPVIPKTLTETFPSAECPTGSRSFAESLVVVDREMALQISSGRKTTAVKTEASEALFDSEMPSDRKIKTEVEEMQTEGKPLTLLSDEEENVVIKQREKGIIKPNKWGQNISSDEEENIALKQREKGIIKSNKRRHSISSDEDDNPFEFIKKRCRKTPTPAAESQSERNAIHPLPPASVSHGAKHRRRSPSPTTLQPQEKVPRKSLSPKPQPCLSGDFISRRHEDKLCLPVLLTLTSDHPDPVSTSQTSIQSSGLVSGHEEHDKYLDGPVPYGFLTTRKPIKDQVEVNPNFEREGIETSAVLVQFENLISRPVRERHQTENQADVPEGMTRWNGKLVPNFKKFQKMKRPGADQLPRIIGGRDLTEHSGASKKLMDDWLRELQEAESQETAREKEVQELFDWQPASRRNKTRR